MLSEGDLVGFDEVPRNSRVLFSERKRFHDLGRVSGAVDELVEVDTDIVKQCEVKIRERRTFVVLDVPSAP